MPPPPGGAFAGAAGASPLAAAVAEKKRLPSTFAIEDNRDANGVDKLDELDDVAADVPTSRGRSICCCGRACARNGVVVALLLGRTCLVSTRPKLFIFRFQLFLIHLWRKLYVDNST